jgi:hypothetical protein
MIPQSRLLLSGKAGFKFIPIRSQMMHCIAQNGVTATVRPRYSSVRHCLLLHGLMEDFRHLEGGDLAMRCRYPLFQYLYQATTHSHKRAGYAVVIAPNIRIRWSIVLMERATR